MKGVLYLAFAITCELFGSSMLKLSNGFSRLGPSIGVIIGFLASFFFLSLALKSMALSVAYATWSGVGTALTAIIGVLLFGENLSLLKIFALFLVIFGIALINKSKDEKTAKILEGQDAIH